MPASIASQGTNGAGGSYFPPQAFRYERGGTPVLSSSSESDDDDTMTSPSKGKALPSPLDAESYINSLHSLKSSRAGSVYSLSRISLSSQLSQLTSLALPDPSSLGPGISAIPTAVAAATTLNNAAEQIKRWLQKASEVLNGLDAEDDVEWAAAGGREGLSDVDEAISRFEGLIRVYVTAIEELQEREDVSKVSPEQLKEQVDQMEDILREWEGVKRSLKEIKSQVELAMEWEELWNNVLGDIGLELESLSRLVFEMEEARHRAVETGLDTSGGVDMQELDTIVEETPLKAGKPLATRVDLSPANDTGSPLSPSSGIPQDDSRLLSLFAKMQPLRASLDFLPMTLSSFRLRAEKCLPSACQELDSQKRSLERKWSVLENDAQGLRRELGEDRWVLVFRNAGRQAQKLCESVERSMGKLQDAVDVGMQHGNPPLLAKKVEAYEAKKSHYGPAIKKVLTIIDKGVTDRQTVNGEILRVHTESKTRWQEIEKEMKNLDSALEDLNMNKNQQLRDSISSIVSIDRSATESIADTPGSSPASSVVMGPSVCLKADASPTLNNSSRRSSTALGQGIRPNGSRRYFSTPGSAPATNLPRKNPVSRSFTNDVSRTASPAPAKFSVTPTPGNRPVRPNIRTDNKPRWNSSSRVDHAEFSTKPRPYPFATPPLHRKGSKTFNSPHSPSGIPLPSPLGQSSPFSSASPASLSHRPRHSAGAHSYAGPRHTSVSATPTTHKTPPSSSHSSKKSFSHGSVDQESPSTYSRPSTSMAGRKRLSMLPIPTYPPSQFACESGGRDSTAAVRMSGHGRVSSLGSKHY